MKLYGCKHTTKLLQTLYDQHRLWPGYWEVIQQDCTMGCPLARAQRTVSRDIGRTLSYNRRTEILHQILTRHFAGEASSGDRPYIVNGEGCVYRGKVQVYSRRVALQQYDSICKEALRDHFGRQLEQVNLFEQVHPVLYDRRNPAAKWYEHTGIGRVPQEISSTIPMGTRGAELCLSQNNNTTASEARERQNCQGIRSSSNTRTNTLGTNVQEFLNTSNGTATTDRNDAQEYWMCINPMWTQRHIEEYLSANPGHFIREVLSVARVAIHTEGHVEVRHSCPSGGNDSSNRGNAVVQPCEENINRGYGNTNKGTTDGQRTGYTNIKVEPVTIDGTAEVPIETTNSEYESGPMVQLQSITEPSTEQERIQQENNSGEYGHRSRENQ